DGGRRGGGDGGNQGGSDRCGAAGAGRCDGSTRGRTSAHTGEEAAEAGEQSSARRSAGCAVARAGPRADDRPQTLFVLTRLSVGVRAAMGMFNVAAKWIIYAPPMPSARSAPQKRRRGSRAVKRPRSRP